MIVLYHVFCIRNLCYVASYFPSGVLLANIDDSWRMLPARGLSDTWDPYREELQASQVIGGGEIAGESVQRLIKRKLGNFVEKCGISVSMGIQNSFWHRDRLAFWKTADFCLENNREKRV